MITVQHRAGFDYLEAAHGVMAQVASIGFNSISFRARSGVTITIRGDELSQGGSYSPAGKVHSITMTSAAGQTMAAISGLDFNLAVAMHAFKSGSGITRILQNNDTIGGTDGGDVIEGYLGNDIIWAGAGNDRIGGGGGNDIIRPGSGNDLVFGGGGDDRAVLPGTRQQWALETTSTGVIARSQVSSDVKILESVESIQFDNGFVYIGDLAGQQISATPLDTYLVGTTGQDRITGSSGDDYLFGAGGRDVLSGGLGNDVFEVDRHDLIVEDADGGYDQVNLISSSGATVTSYRLPEHVEAVALRWSFAADLQGNAADNIMHGSTFRDTLTGNEGDDELHGDAENDIIRGGAGDDRMFGAAGKDTLTAGDGDDQANGGSGDDQIFGGAGDDYLSGDAIGAEGLEGTNAAPAPAANPGVAPNILFVSIDDLAAVFSVFPDAPFVARTPNLDAFFSQSTVFTNAHATAPVCNPSRTSVILGVSPDTSGVFSNNDTVVEAREIYTALPKFLSDSGYYSATSGKVFHNNGDQGNVGSFDEWLTNSKNDDWSPTSWQNAPVGPAQKAMPNVPDEAFMDGRLIANVEEFLGRDHNDPFFFAVGQYRPHAPQHVPKKYFDMHPLSSINLPEIGINDRADLEKLGIAIANGVNSGVIMPDEALSISPSSSELEIKLAIQAYLAAVAYADAAFGEIIAAINQSAYANNTAIVLWSDNGFHLAEKSHFSKLTLWEQATRVPLAFKLPGQTEGATVDSSVSLLDLYKTIADMAGLQAPAHVQGNSLMPLIDNPNLAWDHPSVTVLNGNYAVRSNQYRYIQYWDGTEELYDHRSDATELFNLAKNPLYQSVIESLRRYLPGGADEISGGAGDDRIDGAAGNDVLNGDAGADRIDGGTGDDTIDGGGGNDDLSGGAGYDSLSYAYAAAGVVVSLRVTVAQDTVGSGTDVLSGFEQLIGSLFADTLTGDAAANKIMGNWGDDVLDGLDGNDELSGGLGFDRLFGGNGNDILIDAYGGDALAGGSGNDTYRIGTAWSQITEEADGGTDTVEASRHFGLSANVENLVLIGAVSTNLSGAGNALANVIRGHDGANELNGMSGIDQLYGGAGDDLLIDADGRDTLVGGAGNDLYQIDGHGSVVFEHVGAAGGYDSVRASVSIALARDVERLVLLGNRDLQGFGNQAANVLDGNDGSNHLNGYSGNDQLFGGAGGDTLLGGNGVDLLNGGAGADRLTGGDGDDRFVYDGRGVDTITDWQSFSGDRISLVEARALNGGRALTRSQLLLRQSADGVVVYFDLDRNGRADTFDFDGDGYADGHGLLVDGATLQNLTAVDFIF